MDENFGPRGVDFRAPKPSLGITLIIGGSFPDQRSYVQALMRVGRFNDECLRIQDTTFEAVDRIKNAERKGKIASLSDNVDKHISQKKQEA